MGITLLPINVKLSDIRNVVLDKAFQGGCGKSGENHIVIIVHSAIILIAYHFLTKNNKKLKKFGKNGKRGIFTH